MTRQSLKVFIIFFSFAIVTIDADALENRKFTSPKVIECENGSIVHIRANGKNDTLHRVYSSTGSFVILTAVTSKQAELTVNCTNRAGSAYFDETPVYSYALVFTKMYPFYDAEDVADVNAVPASNVITIPFHKMKWFPVQVAVSNDNRSISAEYSVRESKYFTNGTLRVKLTAFDSQNRALVLPHLMHTVNSTEIKVILDDAPVTTDKSRFAVQILLMVAKNDSGFELEHSRSLDDEFTPGVFKFSQIKSAFVRVDKLGAFAQWKPIIYTTSDSVRQHTTVTEENAMKSYNVTAADEILVDSLANAFYGRQYRDTCARTINVTFGAKADEFYSNTNYSSWTLSTGYGVPPQDQISTAIIIVLVAGLGIPILLLVVGGIYVFVKRSRQKDDLLLSD
uniref:Uncharacterized protein n=1 Tax=Strigamia maritima TaxID=126957 RepID=T1JFV0_STRMM